jgi:hypothetical protein
MKMKNQIKPEKTGTFLYVPARVMMDVNVYDDFFLSLQASHWFPANKRK